MIFRYQFLSNDYAGQTAKVLFLPFAVNVKLSLPIDRFNHVAFILNREFKHDVYGRRKTAKITSDFRFFNCNL